MKISGSYTLPAAPERTYALLQDPEALAASMPGCRELVRTAEDEYEMKMNVVISSIQGLFAGKIRVADKEFPARFRLLVEGDGKIGFLKGEGVLTLSPADGATEVHYDGEVQVGGMIAGVGQRLLDATAKYLIKRFFEKMAARVEQPS
ncbi:MAG: carbon monoxide dehydrogenase subunit G [Bryobacterales bacterium]|nr:carbon monoxide dehydrogenase subunit G [Bryobacteraceae bacterium]MDW8355231.1 carbon monoxide dehydrogenase subunit G [Bryobacterales bacterium]